MQFIRKIRFKWLIHAGILLTFALIPVWYRLPQSPLLARLYVTRFLIFLPMLWAIFWWLVLRAPGLRDLHGWRARWALALLLLVNLVGLNTLAWRTQQALAAQRQANQALLTDSFPQVKVVVDAPLQMAREVAALRQATGAASGRDLEPMLQAFGQLALVQQAPAAIEFAAGELRLKGLSLAASALIEANQRLRPLGLRLDAEGDTAVLRQESGS